ncbi:hypothetical protein CI238_00452 [Colletotrichum incanum]|uniref:Molybdopterin synthase sulfur carrier subunit n=1 Tax=Colletotrichum incanum TaxID=1573173 RepID=A0A161W2W6_COLIC|nr:hypothetical protein CI238_00452 [Colletotrichum incanum]
MSAVPRPPKDHFIVLFFASAGSFTSKQHEAFPAPMSLKKLFDVLEERYSGFKERILESCLVTVNLEYVDIPGPDEGDGLEIRAGDEVAIIPPRALGEDLDPVHLRFKSPKRLRAQQTGPPVTSLIASRRVLRCDVQVTVLAPYRRYLGPSSRRTPVSNRISTLSTSPDFACYGVCPSGLRARSRLPMRREQVWI